MRKVRQLKESLLGWGGYKDVQDKIYLDRHVIYMRGAPYTSDDKKYIKIYPVNIDGTQTNTVFEIEVEDDYSPANERFYFDKITQCIVRTSYTASGSKFNIAGSPVNKHIVFDLYDPNTFEKLDHQEVNAVDSQTLQEDMRKVNAAQGLYSYYCNGIARPATSTDDGREHTATVFLYMPRFKRLFEIPVGDVVNVENPVATTTTDNYAFPRSTYYGIYNNSQDLDDLHNLIIKLYSPHYLAGLSGNMDQNVYDLHINLYTKPVSIELGPNAPLTLNSNVRGPELYTTELYSSLPYTADYTLYGDGNGNTVNKSTQFASIKSVMNDVFNWEGLDYLSSNKRLFGGRASSQNISLLATADGKISKKDIYTGEYSSFTQRLSGIEISGFTGKGQGFAAITSDGKVGLTGGDGSEWTSFLDKLGNHYWNHLYWNGTKLLAVGVYWSIDGSTHETLAYEVYTATSANGITGWKPKRSAKLEEVEFVDRVCVINDTFLVYANNMVSTSTDGENWTDYQPTNIPKEFTSYEIASTGTELFIESKSDVSDTPVFIRSTDGIHWSDPYYPVDYENSIPSTSNYYLAAAGNDLVAFQYRTGSSVTYNVYISRQRDFSKNTTMNYFNSLCTSDIAGTYFNVNANDSDEYMFGGNILSSPALPSGKWDGKLYGLSGNLRYAENLENQVYGSTQFSNNLFQAAISTTTTRIPRYMISPKLVSYPLEISTGNEYIGSLEGYTYHKANEETAYVMKYYSTNVTSSTSGPVLYKSEVHYTLIGKTPTSVEVNVQEPTTITRTPTVSTKPFMYNNEDTWYVTDIVLDTTGQPWTEDNSLPASYLELYESNKKASIAEDFGFYTYMGIMGRGIYTVPLLIKDYYNNGSNGLSYNLYTLASGRSAVTIHESVTDSTASVLDASNEQKYIPTTDKNIAIAYTVNASSSALPRYVNIVSVMPEYDSTTKWFKIKPTTVKIDANTNTYYRENNTYVASAPYESGGFAIPPVVICDGDIYIPEPEEHPDNLYAWAREVNGTTAYVFTSSLNEEDVVNLVYYLKTNGNEFYIPERTPNTIISSFQSDYITTKSGIQYNRAEEYDYAINRDTNRYVPVYIKGWNA